MKQMLLLFALVLLSSCNAQKVVKCYPKSEYNGNVYHSAEVMPSFPGGQDSLKAFINRNLEYPKELGEIRVQGRVFCSFLVKEDGTCTDFEVIRSVNPMLDAEALRVLRLMPKWEPGKLDGKPETIRYTVPVTFRVK